jgi:hypothetical protein
MNRKYTFIYIFISYFFNLTFLYFSSVSTEKTMVIDINLKQIYFVCGHLCLVRHIKSYENQIGGYSIKVTHFCH